MPGVGPRKPQISALRVMSQTVNTYSVQLEVYQGPLDLLLEIIERAELDITKVALAQVTDQYLSYIRGIGKNELTDLSSFLVIAARLMQIKSEALLPRPPEREPGEEDPGDALARQLIAYRKYKQIAIQLYERQKAGLQAFVRLESPRVAEPKLELGGLGPQDLRKVMQQALIAASRSSSLERVLAAPRIRIRDQIVRILKSLRSAGKTTFRALFDAGSSRLEIVVSFLAVLELIKQRRIIAEQGELFGDIELRPGDEWAEGQEIDSELEFDG